MMELSEILEKYREIAFSTRDLGTRFEELMARYLITDPTFASKIQSVVPWNRFHARSEFSKGDVGIDLVAKTKDGEYWAVQCKLYDEKHRVTKHDMDTFLSTSGRQLHDEEGNKTSFAQRMIIATTDNWGFNATEVTKGQTIPVVMVTLEILRNAPVKWEEIEEGVHGKSARKEKYSLREHQKEALDKALIHYKDNDRGRMTMACGTGKTFTSLKIAESLVNRIGKKKGLILFLAPSIALVGQTLREWIHNFEDEINPIAVCSDPKVTKKRTQDDVGETVEDLGMPATTDPQKIISQYQSASNTTVVFSTYQSIDSIINAQKAGLPEFDVIVCDEAHRTTGAIINDEDESYFTKVHSNDNLAAKKRLYMTATPRLYGVKGKEDAAKESVVLCSMDDDEIYGKEFYKITFGKAVELGLLSDYKVLILTAKAEDVPEIFKTHRTGESNEIDIDTDCKIWGSLNALAKKLVFDDTLLRTDPGEMKSTIIFSRMIKRSKKLTVRFNQMAEHPMRPIKLKAEHIDGSMNAMKRDGLLHWLKQDEGYCKALSNVRCLSEGVDVPALDSVIFMDSKGSLVDVVQSVGRVMRRAPHKKYGYIIIPIVVPDDKDPESALNDNERYKVVWQVLRALRSHDERLEAEINTLQFREKREPSNGDDDGDKGDDPDKDDGHLIFDSVRNLKFFGGQYTLEDFNDALLARLVIKVGDREYIENWARKVSDVMPELVDRLKKICQASEYGFKHYKPAFNRYLKGLRESVNDNVSEDDAINMLAQQIVTKPIFLKLFGEEGFAMQNTVSQTIDAMLKEIDTKDGLKDIDEKLEDFYQSVERTLKNVETVEGKQKVITSLYEKFFKNAFPKDQAINGVVYTPEEICDFMIRSAADVLKQEFNVDMSDEGINILDPFTGTGTFIARMMESGIIRKEDLERKYREELFANEITLLAYYIATVNIENTFARITQSEEYVPFENILLTDTFNIEHICNEKTVQTDLSGEEYFKRNKARIRKEHETPITVIIGNPPYGSSQKTTNDEAKKRKYERGVDKKIEETYLSEIFLDEKTSNVNKVYDNYVRAFRWSTDRIGDRDGIIAFVTPNGWLTSSAFEGFRKHIETEFSKIYVFNLRGDATTQGELRRKEGDGVFGGGSRTPICITILVRKKNFNGKAKVLYSSTKDYMKRHEKFNLLKDSGSFTEMETNGSLNKLNIKENGDWIVERNELFQGLIPLAGDTHKKFEKHSEETIFVGYSKGYMTSRDLWSYNFSKDSLSNTMISSIQEYNHQLDNGNAVYNTEIISWSRELVKSFENKVRANFDLEKIQTSLYRPYSKRWFYSDELFIEMAYLNRKIFPNNYSNNLIICVSGVGVKKEFSCLISRIPVDVQLLANDQLFPLYWYEDREGRRSKNKQKSLFEDSEPIIRHDGISDFALRNAKDLYGVDVNKEDIFFYVYGYLHSPEYREAFSVDLKLSMPRIHFVDDYDNFLAFSKAGRELANLHLNYENFKTSEPPSFSGTAPGELLRYPENCRVKKMALSIDDKRLYFNPHLTIEKIPDEAFKYIVNGKSALAWIVDQYQYKKDDKTGIVNDPNEYAGGDYILRLVLSVIEVSVETMRIVKNLPSLGFESADPSKCDSFEIR